MAGRLLQDPVSNRGRFERVPSPAARWLQRAGDRERVGGAGRRAVVSQRQNDLFGITLESKRPGCAVGARLSLRATGWCPARCLEWRDRDWTTSRRPEKGARRMLPAFIPAWLPPDVPALPSALVAACRRLMAGSGATFPSSAAHAWVPTHLFGCRGCVALRAARLMLGG